MLSPRSCFIYDTPKSVNDKDDIVFPLEFWVNHLSQFEVGNVLQSSMQKDKKNVGSL